MAIVIEPQRPEHEAAVRRFNERLMAGGTNPEFAFAEKPPPERGSRPVYFERFVAVEGDEVRGGYVLKRQPFFVGGEPVDAPFYHGPISEGLHDRRYVMVGVQLTRHATRVAPDCFCLGMGGWGQPLPKMLQALKWSFYLIPFYFRVRSPARFLRQISPLRTSPLRRAAATVGAVTGLGGAAIRGAQLVASGFRFGQERSIEASEVDAFGPWCDELWTRCRSRYALIGARDQAALDCLYPSSDERLLRLRVRRKGRDLGWAVMYDTPMHHHKYFGDLRVGTLIDGLCDPDDAEAVVGAATRFLERRGVDLIVSNQAHEAWGRALRRSGFLEGPSNFLFAAAPPLAKRLAPFEVNKTRLHLNRGDGDGPIHL